MNPRLLTALRRTAWVLNNLFYSHFVPAVSSHVTLVTVPLVKSRIPFGPWITEPIISPRTIDGSYTGLSSRYMWAKYAIPKGLPKDGSRSLAIENDPHSVDDFDGLISEGYGKGVKSLLLSDTVVVKIKGHVSVQKINYHVHHADVAGTHYDLVVTGVEPGTKQWELSIPRGELKGRYAFISTNRGALVTRMIDHGTLAPKPKYTLRSEDKLLLVNPATDVVERKVDGSLGNAYVQGHRVYFRSHRLEGETYHDKLPGIEFIGNNSPFLISRLVYPGPSLNGTLFQGELAHQDGSARVSGILNSLPQNARLIQQQRGDVKFFVWDILKYKGRDVSQRPYDERRKIYEAAVRDIRRTNKNWDVVEIMGSDEHPRFFYDRVTKDPLPWGEGVVIKSRGMDTHWDKVKMVGFGYFKLVDILPGEGKYANSIGRLVVENPANGAIGEVGSLAVPDEFRSWMWNHRDDLLGDTVKIRSMEVTERGVPRAGVFYGFHNGEVDLLMQAESMAGGDPKGAMSLVYAMKSAAGWRKK